MTFLLFLLLPLFTIAGFDENHTSRALITVTEHAKLYTFCTEQGKVVKVGTVVNFNARD